VRRIKIYFFFLFNLSSTSLTIRKDGAIISFQNLVNDGDDGRLIDFLLCGVRAKNRIEVIIFYDVFVCCSLKFDGNFVVVGLDNATLAFFLLSIIHGSKEGFGL